MQTHTPHFQQPLQHPFDFQAFLLRRSMEPFQQPAWNPFLETPAKTGEPVVNPEKPHRSLQIPTSI